MKNRRIKAVLFWKDRRDKQIMIQLGRHDNTAEVIRQALFEYLCVDEDKRQNVKALTNAVDQLTDDNAKLRDDNEKLKVNLEWSEQSIKELQQQIDTLTANNKMLGAALKTVSNDPRQIGKLRSILEKQKDQRGN